ncbi:MAG: hypothetical protein K8U03_15820 [Planctomycetia bacterium]|nr:hypothetical protein [Planctomycetia bacterium]
MTRSAATIVRVTMLGVLFATTFDSLPAGEWSKLVEDGIGPRQSPALFWSPERGRFVLLGGIVSHEQKGTYPYGVLTFDAARQQWQNDLPPGAEKRGGEVGPVIDPGFKSPYFELIDRDGIVRPHPHHALLGDQFAYAPWDGKVYALICGRTLRYDPVARGWLDLQPTGGPAPLSRSYKESLNWGALCADPVNREIVLCGGCGLSVDGAGPGTWVYSTEKNEWRDLKLRVQPPSRALSPLVFDPVSKKILLFGGDGLDQLRADTWLYDPATRTWEERTPPIGPSPRFGHALLYLPQSRKLLLVGGNGYTSSVSYQALLYRPLPWEMWTYDAVADAWELIQHAEQDVPRPNPVRELAAAVNDRDELLLVTTRQGNQTPPATWRCAVDTSRTDRAATLRRGVKPHTIEHRTGPYDPAWYEQDVPPADPKETATILERLPVNRWTAIECPKWPHNRMGGGWSTVAFDSDRDQILHLGGGHSSYFGNDVAHYDIATARWSIACRPQFALSYNYDLSGPGPWAFNNAPWGNHNYRAYTYDPVCKRLVNLRAPNHTLCYDPIARKWPSGEQVAAPWPVSKYTSVVCSTPRGVVAWVQNPDQWKMGLFLLEKGRIWTPLPVNGDSLPHTVTDGSTLTYDAKRNQLLMTTSSDQEPLGQLWTYDLTTGRVVKRNPIGMKALPGKRFAREAVFLPHDDLVLFGYRFNGATPIYDPTSNTWSTVELPGSEFMTRTEPGASVDLGLAYDPKRGLVWAVMCQLKPGALQLLRVDRSSLSLKPLE